VSFTLYKLVYHKSISFSTFIFKGGIIMRWPKTEWGIKVLNFKERYGLTLNALCDAAGVIPSVLRQVMIGKTPGYELKAKVDAFIAEYEATHTPGPLLTPFEEAASV
jgi:hypothetical protein